MPRYEHDGKFWEIEVEGKRVTTRFGRIGKQGQTRVKELKQPYEASSYRSTQVAAKLKQGYQLCVPNLPVPEPQAAHSPELEALVLEDATQPEGYMVYADWLQGQGDPRGELISVEHALLARPRDRTLLEERARLRAPYDEQIRQLAAAFHMQIPPGEEHRIRLEWGLGFVRSARLAHDWFADMEQPDVMDAHRLFTTFLSLPSTRLIQELTIGLFRNQEGQADYDGVFRAIGEAAPPALRSLFVADIDYPEQIEISWTNLGDVSQAYPALPRLEQLILQGGTMTLGTMDLPRLRHFEVRTGGLSAASIRSIVTARWPALERLVLWFGDRYYGAEGSVEAIGPILAGEGIGNVRHLGLMNADFTDDLCRALGSAKVLDRLETLDLSMGMMTDDGAAALRAASDRLRGLQRINLSGNYLTHRARELLRDLPQVEIGKQREPDVWDDEVHRYVAVGE